MKMEENRRGGGAEKLRLVGGQAASTRMEADIPDTCQRFLSIRVYLRPSAVRIFESGPTLPRRVNQTKSNQIKPFYFLEAMPPPQKLRSKGLDIRKNCH